MRNPYGSFAASSPNASACVLRRPRIIVFVTGVQQVQDDRHEDRECKRQARGIGEVAHAPALAVPPLEAPEHAVDHPVADAEHEREADREP